MSFREACGEGGRRARRAYGAVAALGRWFYLLHTGYSLYVCYVHTMYIP